jgi:integrase/recombinase XerD
MSNERGKSRVLTSSEFKRVVNMQESKKYGIRNICCLYISFYLGLRAKEISALKIGTFVDTSGNLKKEILLKRKMTKGMVQRRCYLTNDKLIKVLNKYLELRNKSNYNNLDAPLILSQKGSSFTPDTIQKLFSSMYRLVGLDGASSHSGRRSFATKLIENGTGITHVQKLLGHKNIQTTTLYIDENPKLLGKITSGINI